MDDVSKYKITADDFQFLIKLKVKFIGTTKFAAGDWIGVELDSPDGKNNGTVSGVRYFDGQEGHGLFVKKAQVSN